MGVGNSSGMENDLHGKQGATSKEIILTKGMVALVDAADFEWLNSFNWQVSFSDDTFRKTRKYYASRWEVKKFKTRTSKRRKIYMHRFIMGEPYRKVVDHLNGNGLDNRRANLKTATYMQNAQNRFSQGTKDLFEPDVFDEAIAAREGEIF